MSGMSSMDWVTFFTRNGYGGYIWGAIGMCAVVVLGECWALRRKRLQLQQEITQESVEEPLKESARQAPASGVQT